MARPLLKKSLKNKLVRELGEEFVEKMLQKMDIEDLGSLVGKLRKANLSDDMVKKLLEAGDLSKFSDDILRIIKNSNGYADDIIEQIIKYGDQAIRDIKAGYSPKQIRKVQSYIHGIVNNGVVDTTKLSNLRIALENGELDKIEKKLLSKNMDDLGIVNQFEDYMREKMNFNKYLTNMVGPYPSNMVDPHAHHILFKKGLGDT